MPCDLHLTGFPCKLRDWLKVHKAESGETISEFIKQLIYDSEPYEKFMMAQYLRNINIETMEPREGKQ